MTKLKPFEDASRIIITCHKRLTPYLEQEVIALGYTIEEKFQTGLVLEGTVRDCIRLNLNLRCASQIHYSLKSFRCTSPNDLYRAVLQMPWEKFIAEDGYFSVTSHSDHFTVNNDMFVNVKVKDAIADRFREVKGKRPNSGSALTHTVVHLYWKENRAEIFLDTSGETLAKHGYRKIPGKAPMLEALSAATLLATRWDRKSPFINPMCGSGTMAIEAALLATNRRPGLFRNQYAFMHILGYAPAFYEEERKILDEQIQDVEGLKIIASDISRDALEVSRTNAGVAGVDHLIRFELGDFATTTIIPDQPGVVFFNPEYGERLGDLEQLEKTYARMGDFMKKDCKGYTGYIFTGNMDLAKKIGLKASKN
jgi:23S rRNA G2445 N2-methylase RlmL